MHHISLWQGRAFGKPHGRPEGDAAKSSPAPSKKVASAIAHSYIGSSTARSLRLSVRTPGFQPGKRGSIPLGSATFTTFGADFASKVSNPA